MKSEGNYTLLNSTGDTIAGQYRNWEAGRIEGFKGAILLVWKSYSSEHKAFLPNAHVHLVMGFTYELVPMEQI